MMTLEQEQQQAEIKVGKIYEAVNEMAHDARQLVYNGITNENIVRKIFGLTEISGELSFLTNHFSKLVETVDFGELEKKAEKFQKHAETLMRKIEKEIKEQA